MSSFDKAIGIVLKNEGGYVSDPADMGSATNFGVSLRYLKTVDKSIGDLDHDGDIDGADIRKMNVCDAINIYKTQWWDKYGYASINDQDLATKVFDTSVNVGPTQCHKFLQRAVNAVDCTATLKDDGQLGAKSFAAVAKCDPKAVLCSFREQQTEFYKKIVEKNPNNAKFLKGWLRRVAE